MGREGNPNENESGECKKAAQKDSFTQAVLKDQTHAECTGRRRPAWDLQGWAVGIPYGNGESALGLESVLNKKWGR